MLTMLLAAVLVGNLSTITVQPRSLAVAMSRAGLSEDCGMSELDEAITRELQASS
jgi:hypothetical protein